MYRIVAQTEESMWYVTEGLSNKYTMTRIEEAALTYVDMQDAIAVKFIAANLIEQDIDLYIQHDYHTNEGMVWKTTTHMIASDMLDDLLKI